MRRTWLIFSQAVTVAVAMLFVVATLKPQWLRGDALMPATVSVIEAPAGSSDAAVAGFRGAAQVAMPAVVSVVAQKTRPRNPHLDDPILRRFFGQGDAPPQAGLGSGVIVSPEGYLLTNHHVIAGAAEIDVRLADGREVAATLIGTDPETDIAVLKVDLGALPVVALGDIASLRVGDPVLAIGNPFNVGLTVTAGIVSALGRNRLGLSTFENFIQTDAAINPGNSGGALVDARGALVGINTAIYSRSGGSMGIGFAVPVDLAREVLDALVAHGRVIRGWIGVEPQALTPELASTLGLADSQGVLITAVLQDGPAAAAGVRPGDVVLRVDGRAVDSPAALLRAVAALQPARRAELALRREGRDRTVILTVGERPTPGARAPAR
jgi:serine protease DegQ